MKRLLTILECLLICAFTYSQKPTIFKRHSFIINPNSGYVSINDLTYGYGLYVTLKPYGKQYIGFTTIHCYQLNIFGLHIRRSLIAGAGTGVLFYDGAPLIPLFLDFRYMRNFNKLSPYIYEDNGFLLNIAKLNSETKMFINPGAGISLKISGTLAANIGAGLFIQVGPNVSRDSFVNLRMGMSYKPDY